MFTSLVIAGGANKVFCSIGCIRFLEERGELKHLSNFVGTSAGALICFMLALGYTSKEMETCILECVAEDTFGQFDATEVLLLLDTYGLNSGDNIIALGEYILKKKTGRDDITFMELAKTQGKNLVICGANLTDEKEEYFNVDLTPGMSVLVALRITCSIPILFAPYRWNDKLYIDGGFYNNFPINYFKDHTLRDILGINILNRNYQREDSFLGYILFLMNAIFNKANQQPLDDKQRNIVTIEMEDTEWFSLSNMKVMITEEKLMSWVKHGYDTITSKWLVTSTP